MGSKKETLILNKYSPRVYNFNVVDDSICVNKALIEFIKTIYENGFLEDENRREKFSLKYEDLIVKCLSKLVDKISFDNFIDELKKLLILTITKTYPKVAEINKDATVRSICKIVEKILNENELTITVLQDTLSYGNGKTTTNLIKTVVDVVTSDTFTENIRGHLSLSDTLKKLYLLNKSILLKTSDNLVKLLSVHNILKQISSRIRSRDSNKNKTCIILGTEMYIPKIKNNLPSSSNGKKSILFNIAKRIKKLADSIANNTNLTKPSIFTTVIKSIGKFVTGIIGLVTNIISILTGIISIAVKVVKFVFNVVTTLLKFSFTFLKSTVKLLFGLTKGIIKGVAKLAVGFLYKIRKFFYTPVGAYIIGYISGTLYGYLSKYFTPVSIRDKLEYINEAGLKFFKNKEILDLLVKIDKFLKNAPIYESLIGGFIDKVGHYLAPENLTALAKHAAVTGITATFFGAVGAALGSLAGLPLLGYGFGTFVGTLVGDVLADTISPNPAYVDNSWHGDSRIKTIMAPFKHYRKKTSGFEQYVLTKTKFDDGNKMGLAISDLTEGLSFQERPNDEKKLKFLSTVRGLYIDEFIQHRARFGNIYNPNSRGVVEDVGEDIAEQERTWLNVIDELIYEKVEDNKMYLCDDKIHTVELFINWMLDILHGKIKTVELQDGTRSCFVNMKIMQVIKFLTEEKKNLNLNTFLEYMTADEFGAYEKTYSESVRLSKDYAYRLFGNKEYHVGRKFVLHDGLTPVEENNSEKKDQIERNFDTFIQYLTDTFKMYIPNLYKLSLLSLFRRLDGADEANAESFLLKIGEHLYRQYEMKNYEEKKLTDILRMISDQQGISLDLSKPPNTMSGASAIGIWEEAFKSWTEMFRPVETKRSKKLKEEVEQVFKQHETELENTLKTVNDNDLLLLRNDEKKARYELFLAKSKLFLFISDKCNFLGRLWMSNPISYEYVLKSFAYDTQTGLFSIRDKKLAKKITDTEISTIDKSIIWNDLKTKATLHHIKTLLALTDYFNTGDEEELKRSASELDR